MSTVDRALKSIGKANFVEYFEDYKELAISIDKISDNDKMPLAKSFWRIIRMHLNCQAN